MLHEYVARTTFIPELQVGKQKTICKSITKGRGMVSLQSEGRNRYGCFILGEGWEFRKQGDNGEGRGSERSSICEQREQLSTVIEA